MKKTIIYSIAFSLAFILTGISDSFAHKGKPRAKHKRVVVHKPNHHHTYRQPARVRAGYVWVDGHYRWDRRTHSFVWVDGRYLKQKRGKVWVAGHWVRVSSGWTYQPGTWRVVARF